MKISLYIPTFNSENTIKRCLQSVLNQKLKPDEILIIDNNSTDNTIKLVSDIKTRSKIPIIIIFQKKKGLGNARNLGVKNSKYNYIASVDSDCVANKNWLKELTKEFNNPNVAGVCGNLIETKLNSPADKWRKQHMTQTWGNKKILNPRFLYGANNIFLKKAINDVGGYNEKFISNSEDVDISNKFKKKGFNLIYNPSAICKHLRQDSLHSILNNYYRWTFFSYPLPNTFFNLLKRVFIFNPYKILRLILKDLKNFKIQFIFVDILIGFYCTFQDMKYFFKN